MLLDSSFRDNDFQMLNLSPGNLRRLMNIYGPYLGAGVRVEHISQDWSELRVSMKLRWYNKNALGTHFGGSLYSMVDPHLVLLAMKRLGSDYVVWDKAASIDFIKPGRGKVSSKITLSNDRVAEMREKTASGRPYLPEFEIEIFDQEESLVARVEKVLYIKRKGLVAS